MKAAFLLSLFLLVQKAPYVPPGAVEGSLLTLDGKPAIAVRVVAYRFRVRETRTTISTISNWIVLSARHKPTMRVTTA